MPDKKVGKEFLWYEFSDRKKHEWIKYYEDTNWNIISALYDNNNILNEEKLNFYIYKNFLNESLDNISLKIAKYVEIRKLYEIISFDNVNFDKSINISKKKIKKSKWELFKLTKLTNFFDDWDWIEKKDQSKEWIRLIQTWNVWEWIFIDKEDTYKFISEDTYNQLWCKIIQEWDILISRLPTPVWKSCILPKLNYKTITSVDCTIVRLKEDLILPYYFIIISKTNFYLEQINWKVAWAIHKRISRQNLWNIKIPIPPITTQQEIIKKIETVENGINEINEKIIKEQLYIENLINNSDWNEEKLNKFIEPFINWYAFKSEDLINIKKWDEYLEVLKIWNINNNWSITKSNYQYTKYLPNLEKFLINKDDILIAMTWATVWKVAVSSKNNLLLNQRVWKIKEKNISKNYLITVLLSKDFYNFCQTMAHWNAQWNISWEQIWEYKIKVPLNINYISSEIDKIEKTILPLRNKLNDLEIKKLEIIKLYLDIN